MRAGYRFSTDLSVGVSFARVQVDLPSTAPARQRLLAAAREAFAERGFHGARLQDVAARAGVRHPTLLYHYASKEGLYAAVIQDAFGDWAARTEAAISTGLDGVDQLVALVDAGLRFFVDHEDFVRIVRHEALAGGGRLEDAMIAFIRPFLERAVAFLERETAAGRLRVHDPVQLMQVSYATVMTYVSDARFRSRVLGSDPFDPEQLRGYRDTLVGLLRAGLEPLP